MLELLQGEMNDNSQSDAASSSPVALTAREMRRAGLTDAVREEKLARRRRRRLGLLLYKYRPTIV